MKNYFKIFRLQNIRKNMPFARKICCTTYKKICIYQKKAVPLQRENKNNS